MSSSTAFPFTDQRILVVGLAREGVVAAQWLAERGIRIVVSDLRSAEALTQSLAILEPFGVELRLGPQTPDLLTGIDAIVVSPGVPQDIPLLTSARVNSIPITSETRLFAQHCPAPLIGITGSSGKTTTTTLTAKMLEHAGFTTWLGGNIGDPLLGRLSDIRPDDKVVMELSSFQLLTWSKQPDTPAGNLPWHDSRGFSPQIASVLNVTPNHLDRHPSMAHYTAAKAQVLADQTADDLAILSHDDPITAGWARNGRVSVTAGPGQKEVVFPLKSRVLTFGLNRRPQGDGCWIRRGSGLAPPAGSNPTDYACLGCPSARQPQSSQCFGRLLSGNGWWRITRIVDRNRQYIHRCRTPPGGRWLSLRRALGQ